MNFEDSYADYIENELKRRLENNYLENEIMSPNSDKNFDYFDYGKNTFDKKQELFLNKPLRNLVSHPELKELNNSSCDPISMKYFQTKHGENLHTPIHKNGFYSQNELYPRSFDNQYDDFSLIHGLGELQTPLSNYRMNHGVNQEFNHCINQDLGSTRVQLNGAVNSNHKQPHYTNGIKNLQDNYQSTNSLNEQENSASCLRCNEQFKSKKEVISHNKKHIGGRHFYCEICFKTFREQSAIKPHKNIHYGLKPFSCKLCKRTFRQKNSFEHSYQVS